MALIDIEKSLSLDKIDVYHRQLNRYKEVDGRVDIRIPKSLDNDYMGLVAGLFQFVTTWIRYQYVGKLLLDVDVPEQKNWDQLFEKEHIYSIVALCMNKTGVYDSSGEISVIPYINHLMDKIHESMVKIRPMKGWKLILTSVDHFPFSKGLIPCFEDANGNIDNETTVSRNLKPAIDGMLNYSTEVREQFRYVGNDCVAIIHELMKNTYEWGKSDYFNVPVDPGIRGVVIKFFRRVRSKAIKEFMFHKGLSHYFSSERLQENGIEELYFLEISAFDSGVGFVAKYINNKDGQLSEIDIIKRCLIKHHTSSTGLEKNEKGMGLDRILRLLDNRGFLRIKTNRNCIYRNLISHPYKPSSAEDGMELFDWHLHTSTEFTTYPNAQGSVLTIIYPLAINNLI